MLSVNFINSLTDGSLKPLLERVKIDPDLDLHIRPAGYINIYYKGNNLLKINDNANLSVEIHDKFKPVNNFSLNLTNIENCRYFIDNYLPIIKEKIITNKAISKSFEVEYEQLLIRANSYTKKVNSDYFILDRHFADKRESKNIVDLLGIYCDRNKRHGETIKVIPFLGEVKYSLNSDIKKIANQIDRYHSKITESSNNYNIFINRIEKLLVYKAKLGLLKASDGLIAKFKKAIIETDPNKLKIIVILLDYNPYSRLFNESVVAELKKLPFSKKIYIFQAGLAMWQNKNVKNLFDS